MDESGGGVADSGGGVADSNVIEPGACDTGAWTGQSGRSTGRAGRVAGRYGPAGPFYGARTSMRRQLFACDTWENGKSISSIDTGRASIEHGAKTDSDLARPPGGDHPATQQASPGVLTQSAARRGRSAARHVPVTVTRSDASHGPRTRLPGRLADRLGGGAGRWRTGPSRRRTGAGGPGADPGRRRLSGMLAENSLVG
jgi:hypothetical protein